MKLKYYKHIHTNEIVYEDEAELYALEKLGFSVDPKGENGNLTILQQLAIKDLTNWYFSDNWIMEWEDID